MPRGQASSDIYHTLPDPTRRAILDRLRLGPAPVNSILRDFPQSRPTISKHLRVLREARVVVEQRVGRERIYRIEPAELRHPWHDRGLSFLLAVQSRKSQNPLGGRTVSSTKCARSVADLDEGLILATVTIAAPARESFAPSLRKSPSGGVRIKFIASRAGSPTCASGVRGSRRARAQTALRVQGEYLEIDPPRKLVLTWSYDWGEKHVTKLTYRLQVTSEGTRLTIRLEGFKDRPEACSSHSEGWEMVLTWLTQSFAHQRSDYYAAIDSNLDRVFGVLLLIGAALHSYGSISSYRLGTPELVWALSGSLAGGLTATINLVP